MKSIDIGSITLHDSFAHNKRFKMKIRYIDRHPPEDLRHYQFYIIISGRYTDGSVFEKTECKISQSNYYHYKDNYYKIKNTSDKYWYNFFRDNK